VIPGIDPDKQLFENKEISPSWNRQTMTIEKLYRQTPHNGLNELKLDLLHQQRPSEVRENEAPILLKTLYHWTFPCSFSLNLCNCRWPPASRHAWWRTHSSAWCYHTSTISVIQMDTLEG
jgi:hypothetical protein